MRFENALTNSHEVRNSAIHSSHGWGMNVVRSKNLIVDNNVFWQFRQTAVGMNEARAVSFNNNFVGHVLPRNTIETDVLDKHGAVLIGSLTFPKPCVGMRINNNIVAGSVYVGFTAPGHDCDANEPRVFYNNVAHSINAGKNGVGAVIYPDPSKPDH